MGYKAVKRCMNLNICSNHWFAVGIKQSSLVSRCRSCECNLYPEVFITINKCCHTLKWQFVCLSFSFYVCSSFIILFKHQMTYFCFNLKWALETVLVPLFAPFVNRHYAMFYKRLKWIPLKSVYLTEHSYGLSLEFKTISPCFYWLDFKLQYYDIRRSRERWIY